MIILVRWRDIQIRPATMQIGSQLEEKRPCLKVTQPTPILISTFANLGNDPTRLIVEIDPIDLQSAKQN